MIGLVAQGAIAIGVPKRFARAAAWTAIALAIVAAAAGGYGLLKGSWISAGVAKNEAKHVEQHTKTVAEARTDERQAQAVGNQIGAATTAKNVASDANLQTTIKEMHDALDATPPAVAGAAPPVFDARGVSASLNRVVDRANRAAAAADTRP